MQSTPTAYRLLGTNPLSHYEWPDVLLVRDTEEFQEEVAYELDARVRSGDYFVTLATDLEQLSKDISSHSTRLALEDIVSELLYLQDNYSINKRIR